MSCVMVYNTKYDYVTCMCMKFILCSPNAAYSDNGGESGGERVATEGGARVHGPHYLDPLKPHPLQLVIIEPSIRQHLRERLFHIICKGLVQESV